jgi:hypothetical protein
MKQKKGPPLPLRSNLMHFLHSTNKVQGNLFAEIDFHLNFLLSPILLPYYYCNWGLMKASEQTNINPEQKFDVLETFSAAIHNLYR